MCFPASASESTHERWRSPSAAWERLRALLCASAHSHTAPAHALRRPGANHRPANHILFFLRIGLQAASAHAWARPTRNQREHRQAWMKIRTRRRTLDRPKLASGGGCHLADNRRQQRLPPGRRSSAAEVVVRPTIAGGGGRHQSSTAAVNARQALARSGRRHLADTDPRRLRHPTINRPRRRSQTG